jgi:RNA-directed DNA polymerase
VCLPDGSRVRRELHARFCERLAVQLRRPTRPHIGARSRTGKFTVHVKTIAKRLRRGLKAIAEWCREHRHDPVDEQQKTLNAKLRGHYQYYGRPTNYRSIGQFYRRVRCIWREWLSRRTRGRWLTWERFEEILRQHPPVPPRIMHPWAGAGSRA